MIRPSGRDATKDAPPSPEEYRKLKTRVNRSASNDDHPKTPALPAADRSPSCQPRQRRSGPTRTWKAERVSIWQAGQHDNPFGMRLTALMIAKRLPDAAVPISLLADHPDVQFNFFRPGIGTVATEMH